MDLATHTSIPLRVTESWSETIDVELIAPDRVRLLESPLVSDPPIYLGDVVEIRPSGNNQYWPVRVLEAPYSHHSWLLPAGWHESQDAAAYFSSVRNAGGVHEILAGGLLLVHVLISSAFDAAAELARYFDSN